MTLTRRLHWLAQFAAVAALVLAAPLMADGGNANKKQLRKALQKARAEAAKVEAAQAAAAQAKAEAAKAKAEAAKAEAAKARAEAARKAEVAKVEPAKTEAPKAEAKVEPKPAADAWAAARGTAKAIDDAVNRKLKDAGIEASPKADDAEFLRRVSLDLAGVIPTAAEAREFLDSRDPAKREKLVDRLLASENYGKHQADTWINLMLPKSSDNRRLPPTPLYDWLAKNFNDNRPWDAMATDIVTATGKTDENGAVTYTLANLSPDKLTDSVSRLFLGVRVECAQCHNHPFVDWKSDEYWGMAAFFMKVRVDGNPKAALKQGNSPAVSEGQISRFQKKNLPESAKSLPPKFLQGEKPTIKDGDAYRPVFAKWLTSRDNPFFARAMVNRTWAGLFGRGIVDPVDDMHKLNKPSHPELLATLAEQFTGGGYDVKGLIRGIVASDAYQRTSRPTANNASADRENRLYSRMTVRVLTPEQLFDSLAVVAGPPTERGGGKGKQGAFADKFAGRNGPRAQFVTFFTTTETPDPTKYEAGIPQALRLMNSPALSAGGSRLRQSVPTGATPAAAVEHLYLTAVSRKPTPAETLKLVDYVGKQSARDEAYGDVLWALLNSSEFATNH
jgi:chemotaxis protein histidine kinase CheA